MIIKSLSRKTPSFEQLLAYMLEPEAARLDLRHNLPASAGTPGAVVRQFAENHALLPRRANGNALFHEILALPPDSEISTTRQVEALRHLAARYLEQRAPHQLAVGVIHADTPHVHLHLMISSNAVLSKTRVWLKKAAFAEIQREVEAYRLEHFPELGRAAHYTCGRQGAKLTNREQAKRTRTGAPTHKEQLAATLATILSSARSREALATALAEQNLELYQRGRGVGVQTAGGRRYRFATLGLAEAYTEAAARFELTESRMASLSRGRVRSERGREWERRGEE